MSGEDRMALSQRSVHHVWFVCRPPHPIGGSRHCLSTRNATEGMLSGCKWASLATYPYSNAVLHPHGPPWLSGLKPS